MTYKDFNSALAVLDVRLERCTERTLSSDRDALELELLELLKVVDLDIYTHVMYQFYEMLNTVE